VFGIHLDVSEHGEIVPRLDATQMGLQVAGERLFISGGLRQFGGVFVVGEELDAVFLKHRLLGG